MHKRVGKGYMGGQWERRVQTGGQGGMSGGTEWWGGEGADQNLEPVVGKVGLFCGCKQERTGVLFPK